MHTQHSCLSTLAPPARATFERQLAEGFQTPGLHPLLSHGREDLFPRFARYYDHLCHLPRRARRALQRQWKRSLSAIALLLALGQVPAALAAQIDVGVGGCTLVDAITAANTDIATGRCPAGSGADVIALTRNVTLRAVNNSTYGPTGLPVVTSAIVIDGNGRTIARDPQAPEFRILAVGSGDLTLQETTVTGGVAPGHFGGGIANFGGTALLTDSTVSGNSASAGGGVSSFYGTLTLTKSTVSGNSADQGGGVNGFGTVLTLTNSTVSGNSAESNGGGVAGSLSTLTLTDSTVSGNGAGGNGGGVNISNYDLTLTNSTVSGNSANGKGGGVYSTGGGVFGLVTLTRSLISGNTAPDGAEVSLSDSTINADDFNLFGHADVTDADAFVGFVPGANDIDATSDGTNTPLVNILAALADNGGPTKTHALVAGSPALDASPVDKDCALSSHVKIS